MRLLLSSYLSAWAPFDTQRYALCMIHHNPEVFIKSNFLLDILVAFRRKERLDEREGREYEKKKTKM
jgi:hypothetical protein